MFILGVRTFRKKRPCLCLEAWSCQTSRVWHEGEETRQDKGDKGQRSSRLKRKGPSSASAPAQLSAGAVRVRVKRIMGRGPCGSAEHAWSPVWATDPGILMSLRRGRRGRGDGGDGGGRRGRRGPSCCSSWSSPRPSWSSLHPSWCHHRDPSLNSGAPGSPGAS